MSVAAAAAAGGCLKVCAARLPTSWDKAATWRHFEKCGRVRDVFLLMDWWTWQSKGVGFITFEDEQGVKAALALDGSELEGQKIRVNLAVDKVGPAWKADGKGGKGTGKGASYSYGKGKYGGGGGSGYAYGGKGGKSATAAPMALADVPAPEAGCPGVLVKGLAFSATEDEIRQHFASCGRGPSGVRLMKDKRTGESKGKAFVDFDQDLSGSHAAMRMTGQSLKGRRMAIEYVRSRPAGE
mmetsp:Transcript_58445/g.169566  ORF Transcript_58445/g.169566 Transcript_58445/m.169566 type:complete len:240 (+) Transcript_58445:1992-2711(+)